jgi:hypothetical protein
VCVPLLSFLYSLCSFQYTRWAGCLGHVSRGSHHGHPEQVSFFRDTLSLPRRAHPLNRFLAWPSLLLGISAWVNQHPLRTKEGATPPIGNLMSVLHTRVSLAMLNPFTGLLFLPLSRPIFPSS